MLQDPLTLYKLIVLYMLDRVTYPLTRSQIVNFVLDRDYTNFMTLQQVFSELIDADMITSQTIRNRTPLVITNEGKKTLHFFENRINDEIKNEINNWLKENEFTLKNEMAIQGDYYKSTSGEYEAHLVAKERDINLIELTLSVPTEEIAAQICDNWQKKNQSLYQYLIRELF
jgi:hypothetical protein